MTESALESLLRDHPITYGHIQLFRDASGWQASVYHYEPKQLTDSTVYSDPVDALRAALIEDHRRGRELERKYAATRLVRKVVDAPQPTSVLTKRDDDFEDMFE